MCELGAREAIMTMPDGCFARMLPRGATAASPRSTACACRAGAIEPRATVGSGDAFLAGFVAARYKGRPTAECLAYGVACGAESTQHLGAGLVDPDRVERLLGEVEVRASGIYRPKRHNGRRASLGGAPSAPTLGFRHGN